MQVSFEYELDRGDEIVTIEVDAWITYSYDSDYGSDADGNRGVEMRFVEDVELDVGGLPLTDKEIELISEYAVELAN
jgi:hypothetical protein